MRTYKCLSVFLAVLSTALSISIAVDAAPASAGSACVSDGSSLDTLGSSSNFIAQCSGSVTWTSKGKVTVTLVKGDYILKGKTGIGYKVNCGTRGGTAASWSGTTSTCGGTVAAPPAQAASANPTRRPDTSDYACMGIAQLGSAKIRKIQQHLRDDRNYDISVDGYASLGGETCLAAVKEAAFSSYTKKFIEDTVTEQYPVNGTPPVKVYEPGVPDGPSTADNVISHISRGGAVSAVCLGAALIGAAFTFGTSWLLVPVIGAPICAIGGTALTW